MTKFYFHFDLHPPINVAMQPLDEEPTRKRNWVKVNIQNDFRDKKKIMYKKCYDPI